MKPVELIVSVFCLLLPVFSFGQGKVTLSGSVYSEQENQAIHGAILHIKSQDINTTTDPNGSFQLTLEPGVYTLQVSHVGYKPYEEEIAVKEDTKLEIKLKSAPRNIQEVVVNQEGKKGDFVKSPQMSLIALKAEDLKSIPIVFGEKDILKTLQLMPGVSSAGEGNASFYVRGGKEDQNLILLDQATVYNPTHLLGFFSTFNSDAINSLQLYKGGIPAQYGGRLSSVIDIQTQQGSKDKFGVNGGIGLIASRMMVQGPMSSGKGTYMLSARRTYADMFLKIAKDKDVRNSHLYFYDLNAQASYTLNPKHELTLSAYSGTDDLGYKETFNFSWSNMVGSLGLHSKWNSNLSSKLFLIYSDYDYNIEVNSTSNVFSIESRIRNFGLKNHFDYLINENQRINFGVSLIHQSVLPSDLKGKQSVNSIRSERRKGLEGALYASYEQQWTPRLSSFLGFRVTDFMVLGPGTFYTFDEQGEVEREEHYGRSILKHMVHFEPRLAVSYQTGASSSVKLSYNRLTQHLQQLSNTTSSLPTDQYVMTSLQVKPQLADQLALGFFKTFRDSVYQFSIESYYKHMLNQVELRDGADLQFNKYVEGELTFGLGRSYGVELLLRKNRGKFKGWIGYTLAKSEKQFDDIRNGDWFPARQDRRHDASLVVMYSLSPKWTLSGTFVYQTGQAVTFPTGKYEIDGKTMYYYSNRNAHRMPDYHRLDLSFTYEPSFKVNKFHSSWSFGLYNAYNQKNAYLINFREQDDNKEKIEAYKISLFGIIPSLTWNFKF